MFVCTAWPSRTLATSDTRTTRPSTERSGRVEKSWTVSGLALVVMVISRWSTRNAPEGMIATTGTPGSTNASVPCLSSEAESP